jgi:hypothetical protein
VKLAVDMAQRFWQCDRVTNEELPLNDIRRQVRKGTKAWVAVELETFRELSRKHGGLTTPWFAKIALGVSRQRVYALMESGHLPSFELLGKKFIACDELQAFVALDRHSGYRYPDSAAA